MKKLLSLCVLVSLVLTLAACGAKPGFPDEDGYAEGRLEDTMHNYFFDFTVNSAAQVLTYGDYTPAEGNSLLVVDVTVKNTFEESIPMYDTDFQVQWGEDDDDEAFAIPVEDGLSDKQLPTEYELTVGESRTGELVFEVPTGNKDFSFSYQEYFSSEDETLASGEDMGNVFFVFFTAEAAA